MLFPVLIRREADVFFEYPRKMRGRRKSEIVPDGGGTAVSIAEEAFGLLRFLRAPGMVDNLVVKVHYGLGSRNR